MAWAATAIGGSAVLSYMGSQSASDAATNASNANINYMRQNDAANRAQIEKWNTLNDPFSAGGHRAQYVGKLEELMSGNPSDIYNDPIFQNNIQLGEEAISRRFASEGAGGSGAEKIGLMRYTTGMAQSAYDEKFKRLASLSGAENGRSAAPQSTGVRGIDPQLAGGMAAAPYNIGASALSALGGIYGRTSGGTPGGGGTIGSNGVYQSGQHSVQGNSDYIYDI